VTLALIVAAVGLYVGTQKHLPPLYGLARNGFVLASNGNGGVVSVDPATGTRHTLVAGPNLCCATISPDGQHISYLHVPTPDADPAALTIANIDGTTVRDIPGDIIKGLDWLAWNPSSDRVLLSDTYSAQIVDVASGALTKLTGPDRVNRAAWIGTTGDALLTSMVSDTVNRIYRMPAGATSNPKLIAEIQYLVAPPQVSPDGSKFLYFIWGPEERLHGDIHVFDLATGSDTAITEEAFSDSLMWENPNWSPDGSKIAAELYQSDGGFRIAVIPATGGDPVVVGPNYPEGTNGAHIQFSPDGQSLLVTFNKDGATWLLPVGGGQGQQVSWSSSEDLDWQRLAVQ
jgi:Tol biopolymer transport system component